MCEPQKPTAHIEIVNMAIVTARKVSYNVAIWTYRKLHLFTFDDMFF